jgi:hypothetical protein
MGSGGMKYMPSFIKIGSGIQNLIGGNTQTYRQHVDLIGKAIPVTGRGGPYVCETSRFPHFLENRLTDGGEIVSLTSRPPFTPPPSKKIPGTHFC